ncbi:MAG: DUF1295 domain-containing protein [Alphaproteobacteria bacterium]|nr:DUF1295 domain-containing protein [Alphaproteobacteria bacterium]
MSVLILTFVTILASTVALWPLSLLLRDCSIIDIFWSFGFLIIALVAMQAAQADGARTLMVVGLVALWAFRLGVHIFLRWRKKGEDYRYAAMRAKHGARWWWWSFFQVFMLQALLLWTISLPVQAAILAPDSTHGLTDALGAMLVLCGIALEAVADIQLTHFRANPANAGRVMDRGVWRWSRHPNYFADALMWWGFYIIALGIGGWWTIIGPIVMTVLLLKVSGVSLMEDGIDERRPAYADYKRRVSAFVPMPPRRG